MPLYEYSCGACGKTSEINHRMSDPSPTDCPACGQPKLEKLISAAGFRLKGAGWYETDFKSDGKRNLAGDSGGGDSKPGETKTETKPDTKAAAPAAATATPAASSPGA